MSQQQLPEGQDATVLPHLVNGLGTMELSLSSKQLDQFAHYQAIVLAWNQDINLTAITEPAGIQIRHFLDSLSCLTVTGELGGRRLVDVGSGAGFPGLPLKIYCPQMQLTLVESVAKKARFLEAVVEDLGLDGVTIQAARAEEVGRLAAHREGYDWAVARSVASMPVLVEYLLPLCRLGGQIVAMKGESAAEETEKAAEAIRVLGGGKPRIHPVNLPEERARHYLVVVEKLALTPVRYPRRSGIPAKRPL